MNIALGVITVAVLTRDKVIGSSWLADIDLAVARSCTVSPFARGRASIFNTCSIMRFLARTGVQQRRPLDGTSIDLYCKMRIVSDLINSRGENFLKNSSAFSDL